MFPSPSHAARWKCKVVFLQLAPPMGSALWWHQLFSSPLGGMIRIRADYSYNSSRRRVHRDITRTNWINKDQTGLTRLAINCWAEPNCSDLGGGGWIGFYWSGEEEVVWMDGFQAYGAGKAGGAFDPLTFIRQPQTVVRILCWVSRRIKWWCHNILEVWINKQVIVC